MPQFPSTSSPQASPGDSARPDWVIVQLSPLGEREKDLRLLSKSVCHILGRTIDVFVPAVSQAARGDSVTTFYMDGYIFVRHMPGVPYSNLADTPYFSSVLTGPGGKFALLKDEALDSMRDGMDQLQSVRLVEGDSVRVVEGKYKNLTGRISCTYEDSKVVQLSFEKRSKKMLIDFPVTYLKKI